MVPLVEAAPRHRSDAPCFHSYDATTDSYVLRTLRPLGCGEEVTVCRGRGGDASLLLGESGASNADAEVCWRENPPDASFLIETVECVYRDQLLRTAIATFES